MVSQILFPTDFSNAAHHAFPAALRIAALLGAEITTVHAYVEPHIPQGYMTRTLAEIIESTEYEELELYRERLTPLHELAESLGFGHISIKHALCPGTEIVQQILQTAKKERADLIIMGTTGSQGIQELFQGTIASEVLENAGCPVLLIPENIVLHASVRRIAFAIDATSGMEPAAKWLHSFATALGAEICYLNLPGFEEADFAAWADSRNIAAETRILCNCWSDETALAQFLEAHTIDILALTTHKTSFFYEFFRQNFEKHLARVLAYPLLGIPKHNG